MSIKLKWAEVHTPLFVAGCNLGQKLDPHKRTGLKLLLDKEENLLEVHWNQEIGYVPLSNVAVMIKAAEHHEPKPTPAPAPAAKVEAQVSTPQDHVFKGPGAGKTK